VKEDRTMTNENTEIEVHDKRAVDASVGEPTWAGKFFTPAVDIYSTDTETVVSADLPGVTQDGLEIDLRDGVLTLVGKVHQVPEPYRSLQHEYEIGGYLRRFTLGDDIDADNIDATLKDGVLTLLLPKAKQALPRKIQVNVV